MYTIYHILYIIYMSNFFLLKLAVKAKSLLGLKSFGTIWKN